MVSETANISSTSGYRRLKAEEVSHTLSSRKFGLDVLTGLSERPKRLPSRYFYDDEGSRLFSAICDSEDYYPTRSESEILETYIDQVLDQVGTSRPLNVVDLGAGDGRKTMAFLDRFSERGFDVQFVPIDISEGAMRDLIDRLQDERPRLRVSGIVADYFDGLHWLSQSKERLNLVLFLGSNIGNFNNQQARVFLRQLWESLNPHDLVFTGFDLKKDIEILLRAYNDSEGLTARFNLNLLTRINRELGANFDTRRFRHYGTYDVQSGAMESYLVSLARQSVYIESLHQTFEFEPWEAVHTEYSYKYLETDIVDLAAVTDFQPIGHWYDSRHWFTNHLWRVEKSVPVIKR